MKKLTLILMVAAMVVAPSFAGGQQEAAEDDNVITVGLSWNEQMQSLVQAWQDYMVQYSGELAAEEGVEFEWVVNVADSDPSQQNSNIEDLINQRVDIIVARPHDAAAIGASIRSAQDAGIPFVTFDRASSTVEPNAHVGADSYDQGVTTAEAFVELLESEGVEGKCIELLGDLRDENAVNRSDGWNSVVEETDVIENVAEVPTEWTPEKFYTGTKNALEANPEANCIFVPSDFTFRSVQAALEEADRWAPAGEPNHMWIAAQDLNPQGYEAMQGGYIDVATTYDAYFHAVEVVDVVYRIAQGEEMQGEEFLVAGRVATPEKLPDMENMWARDYAD